MNNEPKNGGEKRSESRRMEHRRQEDQRPSAEERRRGDRRKAVSVQVEPRIEHVARALCRAVGKNPDDFVRTGRTIRTRSSTTGVLLEEEKVPCWQQRECLDEAQKFVAAFEALSIQGEPTDAPERRGESRRKTERRREDRGPPAEGERRRRDRRKDERRKP
jgi:hypothetical protein